MGGAPAVLAARQYCSERLLGGHCRRAVTSGRSTREASERWADGRAHCRCQRRTLLECSQGNRVP